MPQNSPCSTTPITCVRVHAHDARERVNAPAHPRLPVPSAGLASDETGAPTYLQDLGGRGVRVRQRALEVQVHDVVAVVGDRHLLTIGLVVGGAPPSQHLHTRRLSPHRAEHTNGSERTRARRRDWQWRQPIHLLPAACAGQRLPADSQRR
jgi:hypothetical protein